MSGGFDCNGNSEFVTEPSPYKYSRGFSPREEDERVETFADNPDEESLQDLNVQDGPENILTQ
jgi:hypothetical protein